jgi:hypothetical protein
VHCEDRKRGPTAKKEQNPCIEGMKTKKVRKCEEMGSENTGQGTNATRMKVQTWKSRNKKTKRYPRSGDKRRLRGQETRSLEETRREAKEDTMPGHCPMVVRRP